MNKNSGRTTHRIPIWISTGHAIDGCEIVGIFMGLERIPAGAARWNLPGTVQVWDAADESVDELA